MPTKISDLLAQAQSDQNAQDMSHSEFTPLLDLEPISDAFKAPLAALAGGYVELSEMLGQGQLERYKVQAAVRAAQSPDRSDPPSFRTDQYESGKLPGGYYWWADKIGIEDPDGAFSVIGQLLQPDLKDVTKFGPLVIGSLLGRKGASPAMLSKLDQAMELFAKHGDDIEAFARTGWFLDPTDKQWKFRIPDNNVQIKWDVINKRGRSTGNLRLAEFVDAPEIFEAYPQIADYRVRYEILDEANLSAATGHWNEAKREAYLSAHRNRMRELYIHEMQHMIQDIEGFAPGGTPSYSPARIWNDKTKEWQDATVEETIDRFTQRTQENIDKLTKIQLRKKYTDAISQIRNRSDLQNPDVLYDLLARENIPIDIVDDDELNKVILEQGMILDPGTDPEIVAALLTDRELLVHERNFLQDQMRFYEAVERDMLRELENDRILSAPQDPNDPYMYVGTGTPGYEAIRRRFFDDYWGMAGEVNARWAQSEAARIEALQWSMEQTQDWYAANHPFRSRTEGSRNRFIENEMIARGGRKPTMHLQQLSQFPSSAAARERRALLSAQDKAAVEAKIKELDATTKP